MYSIVRNIGTQNTHAIKRESYLVKLDEPIICRKQKTIDLYEIDHVIVEALRIVDDGVAYEETHVVASNEDGQVQESVLYLATKALTVPEALFSIGYNQTPPTEPENEEANGDQEVQPESGAGEGTDTEEPV